MTKDYTKTLRIRKVAKVAPDERGRSVWLGKIDTVELELVSTTALEKILKSESGKTRSEIRKLAAGRKDGVLARDTATGHFRILSDADLRKAEPITDKSRSAADELSLVNTQILRKALNPDAKPETPKPKTGKKDKFGGFNPYDNN
ncbi:MAG: hypothetical protein WD944_07235 [Steroidobacteraceae bacterium]